MNNIKVSVVIAVYNAYKFIKQTMDTLISQTLKEIEIICVDDASIDGTSEILDEYALIDDRIKVYHIDHVGYGAANARNFGLKKAKGQFVSILDGDDFFEQKMLEKAYEKAVGNNSDTICFNAYKFDQKAQRDRSYNTTLCTEFLPEEDIIYPDKFTEHLFQITSGTAWNCLFSKKMIDEYSLEFYGVNHADDLVFTYLCFACSKKISILNERLIHYRYNFDTSQTANKTQYPESGYLATLFLKEKLIEYGIYDKYKNTYLRKAASYAIYYLETMLSLNSFEKLFFDLKNKYLYELGLLDIDSTILSDDISNRISMIKDEMPLDYLFKIKNVYLPNDISNNIIRASEYIGIIPDDSKVVIYGAGLYGNSVFSSLLFNKRVKIVSWVDRDYLKLGYPVQNPENINNYEFDICFVAIENYEVYLKVKKYLLKLGVPNEKIFWLMQNKDDMYVN